MGEVWEKYKRKFIYWRPIRSFLYLTQKMTLPGFHGFSLYYIARFFIKGLREGAITQRAAALSYSFFLALFPTIIFFFTLIPYLPIKDLLQQVYENLANIVPTAVYPAVRNTIDGILIKKHTSLLSFGFLAALYFSTNGMDAIITAFNQTTHNIESRKFIKRKLICLLLVFILVALIVLTFSFLVGFKFLISYLMHTGVFSSNFIYFLFLFGKWLLMVLLTCTTISVIYYLAPAQKAGFHFISPGSILATVLFMLSTVGFNLYIDNFSRYNALYGSIGTLLIVLIWINLNAIVLLLGYELNASIAEKTNEIKQKKLSLSNQNI